jgi:hypothetical protein
MDNKKWLHSQFFILGGCTLIVFYLAGIHLLMLLYGSRRSAPIGEPGATYAIQNYIVPLVPLLVQTAISRKTANLAPMPPWKQCQTSQKTALPKLFNLF